MGLHIGSTAPNFTQQSTAGEITFHDWIGDGWALLFSHPADYTPVCTTELGTVARIADALTTRGVKAIAVSIDDNESHMGWIADIEDTQGVKMNFPILADPDRKVASLYDMIHAESGSTLTVRSVFFIDPNKKIRAMITYPAATGRNFDEILRVVDSLQLTDNYKVATPANWKDGDDVIIVPSIQDETELKERFPKGYKVVRPYLRVTPQPNK
ncbi:MAG: alkyl hydroperoxide reductase subunit AhpC [Myxococcota bacterium]|jgi:alkyl hydroperoxide reductase subunit AhpC